MVIINRNDLSIRNMNRVNARGMQDCTVAGFGAVVSLAGSQLPRPITWPVLAPQASKPGNTAQSYPVHPTGKPKAEATKLESEVFLVRIERDYPSPERTTKTQDRKTLSLQKSSQLCAPTTTAQK